MQFFKSSLRSLPSIIFTCLLTVSYISQTEAVTIAPQPSSLLSHVTDTVTNNGGGSWTYGFEVHNDTSAPLLANAASIDGGELPVPGDKGIDIIVDWELPYFSDMRITNIQSPEGWAFAIETIGTANPATGWGGVADWQTDGNPWKVIFDAQYGSAAANPFNDHTHVLHWYTLDQDSAIFPQDSLAGFSFDAAFDAGQAPYQASWNQQRIRTGDPAFPTSPNLALPNSPSIAAVPLPGAALLMLSGLIGMCGFFRKKPVSL